jgi:uncharacterized protein (DUF362 family)
LSLVSFVKVQGHTYDTLTEAIESSINLINFSFEGTIDKIVIKPNMCYYYHPSTGMVTDPWFVGVLIDVLRRNFGKSCKIAVVESDATAMKCRYVFGMLGYDRLAEEKNVELVNLSETESRIIDVEVDDEHFQFHVPELFYESDLLVNVPKLKYMREVKVTCALKNIFGCNAYARKFEYHRALNEAVVGINKVIRTGLVVVDGLIVNGKYTRRLGLVMSSEDPVAVDAAASNLMGINPKSVKQIGLASHEGVGKSAFTPIGDFPFFKKEFPKKTLKDKFRHAFAAAYLRTFQKE